MSAPEISVSVELMQNYKQTLLMSPENDFEALQTSDGNALLFSVGTDNVFYVTEESSGHETGWQKTDLSSKQIASSFPGQQGLTCKLFANGQSVVDGTIGLAMVINDGTCDHLFLSLGNASDNTAWTASPVWIQYPFDNPAKNIVIAGVFLSETMNNTQYIVVDILRDATSAEKLISRYYINTQTTPVWQPHDVSIDLEANSYTSCLGRQYLSSSPHQPTIDGLYTCGQVDGLPQFTFQPLYNVFNPDVPAAVARFSLPGNAIADCIASCRKSNMSTDLYACSGGALYYFASTNQADGAVGVQLMQNPVFTNVKKMYSAQSNQVSIVWGLNGNNDIFYVSCPTGQETATPSCWSIPLPIVTGVDLFSPYLNRVDDGNSFFAVAGGTLQKWVKSTNSTLWNAQYITLPSPDTTDTQQYSSYTTHIQVTDENNQPLADEPVTISALTRTGVYINNLYYIVDPQGIEVATDALGSITVIEWVTGLTGTTLTVRDSSGNTTQVEPMATPMAKIAQLNTVSGLRSAVINQGGGNTTPLVSSSVSDSDLQTVASSNQQLGTLYNNLAAQPAGQAHPLRYAATPQPGLIRVSGVDALLVDIGDLFSWLASGVEAVIEIVEDAATKTWNFIAHIADTVYTAVLDVAEKVVAAAVWVFNAIKTAVTDLIHYLQFLFEFDDILVTHRVMKNVFIQWVQQSIADVSGLKSDVVTAFTALQNDVNRWADIPSFAQTPASTSAENPPLSGQNSAPAQMGIHHYQSNVGSASSTFTTPSVASEIFDDLLNLLNNEADTLGAAYDAIKTDIIDQFDTLTLTQIIEKFTAIIVDTLLQTTENILCAAIDVFVQLAEGFIDMLTATIDIPVISWLYKKLTGDDLSFLDLICFIAAIPATVVYKIACNETPFSNDDPFTQGLLAAQNFDQVRSEFFVNPTVAAQSSKALVLSEQPVLDDHRLKVFGFVSGFFALAGSIGLIIATTRQRAGGDEMPVSQKKTLALVAAVSNVAYVSPNIATLINAATDTWWQQMNNVLTSISIIKGFVNIPLATLPGNTASTISAGVESVINLLWNIPVILNVIENKNKYNTTYKSLIPETIANFSFNFGGMLEYPIARKKDPRMCLAQYGLMLGYGVVILIAGSINDFTKSKGTTPG
ncbi:hypothetical protein EHW64_10675 [Erwinia psidii]|uniref:hypothetical protein n=1 Tax=Erwinia psidii TaxID=69224 RepID=UPI00226B80B6|nr:hypothetical protein [Erwinia psidii]MCX8961600.1 hypothetical protein [Erwinia psidii]